MSISKPQGQPARGNTKYADCCGRRPQGSTTTSAWTPRNLRLPTNPNQARNRATNAPEEEKSLHQSFGRRKAHALRPREKTNLSQSRIKHHDRENHTLNKQQRPTLDSTVGIRDNKTRDRYVIYWPHGTLVECPNNLSYPSCSSLVRRAQ